MADNSNPQVVKFTNEQLRVSADAAVQLYWTYKKLVGNWFAGNIPSLLSATTDNIADGAQQDGRVIVNGISAYNLMTRAQEYVSDMEANGGAKLNTLLAVAVNTQSRF